MSRCLKISILVISFFWGCANAASIHFLAPTTTFSPGDRITLLLVGRGFDQPLDGGGVDIEFDKKLVKVDSVAVDKSVWEFEADPPRNPRILDEDGLVKDVEFNTFRTVKGDFNIATLTLTALAGGIVDIKLVPGSNPFGSGGNLLPVTLENVQINISAVPLPSALLLLLSGIGSVNCFRTKR